MPNMASITVKDGANVDVVYNAASASSGDANPAIWRANAANATMAFRPLFKFATQPNVAGTTRKIRGTLTYPVTATVAGVETLLGTIPLAIEGALPVNLPASAWEDAFVQFGNLLVSSLIRESVESGYAPT